MTKKVETGAAPVSKYAAKRRNFIVANEVENTTTNAVDASEESTSTINGDRVNDSDNVQNHDARRPFKSYRKKKELPAIVENFPEHVVQIALLIKNNAEIRRFTALGILNYLLQKKEIVGEKRYVSFKWNKFAVKANGLMREYSYNEPFFLNALVAAFSSFSASAQRTIDNFCHKEMSVGITKAVDQEEVTNIIALNEEYQGDGSESED